MMNAKLLALPLILTALAANAGDRQPVDNDPGPPYQFTIVDLVYRIESIGGVVQDLEGERDSDGGSSRYGGGRVVRFR